MKDDKRQIPVGTNRLSVFDTNAYRELTAEKSLPESRDVAVRVRKLEMSARTISAANPFVIWELIAHLDGVTDPAYERCLNALVALAEHTWSRSDLNSGVCLVADSQSTVCDELFGKVPSSARRNVESLGALATHVLQCAPTLTDPAAIKNIRAFATEMKKKEAEWLTGLQASLEACDPLLARAWIGGRTDKETRKKLVDFFGSELFVDAWSKIGVMTHAELVGVTLNEKELAEKADVMRNVFAAPFHLMSALLQKFPTARDLNLASKKRKWGNYMWDAAICHTIGRFHQLDGAEVLLVTGDRAIVDAAVTAGCSTSVSSLSDYRRSLGF
jgi:hypothetical protein